MVLFLEALAFIAAVVCAAFGYRALRQCQNAKRFSIRTANRIDEALFVRIGGIEQWVKIRSEDRNNPVLLVLHGGLALSYMAFTPLFRQWEKHFTIVQWDRRGTGKTFGRNCQTGHGELTLERITCDGIELAEWLARGLHKEKIFLLGHSMGSLPGLTMAAKCPSLFEAYVGCEQVVNMQRNETVSYQMMLTALHESGDRKNLKVLTRIGPPPYANIGIWKAKQRLAPKIDPVFRKLVQQTIPALLLTSPSYSLMDLFDFIGGNLFSGEQLFAHWMAFDAKELGSRFELPIYIIQGERDIMAPKSLAQEWFDGIEAPRKTFATMASSGHLIMFATPGLVLDKLLALLNPATFEMSRSLEGDRHLSNAQYSIGRKA